MGIFEESSYKKDKNGKWQLVETKIVKAPHDIGFWKKSAENDAEKYGDETVLKTLDTRSGLNKKVSYVGSYFSPTEKVERKLITTASKLSKKDREKYKGIQGYDKPIRR